MITSIFLTKFVYVQDLLKIQLVNFCSFHTPIAFNFKDDYIIEIMCEQ